MSSGDIQIKRLNIKANLIYLGFDYMCFTVMFTDDIETPMRTVHLFEIRSCLRTKGRISRE